MFFKEFPKIGKNELGTTKDQLCPNFEYELSITIQSTKLDCNPD